MVAEGVETQEQFQKVTDLGCDYVQGYYFAKPVGAQTTQALMVTRDELQRAFATLQGAAGPGGPSDPRHVATESCAEGAPAETAALIPSV
jgi:hypothetical protein